MTTNPTWYDILGIDRDASADEIKAAWRTATDKFEPGSGTTQFGLFNQAADTLLDPDKRAAYDAGLDDPVDARDQVAALPEPDVTEAGTAVVPVISGPRPGLLARMRRPALRLPSAGRPLTLVLALVAVCLLATTVLLGIKAHDRALEARAGTEAVSVADRALVAVLSYDYRHMDEDRDRAVTFLTPDYTKDYVKTFDLLTDGPEGSPGGVVKTKTVVTADVLDAAVVRAEKDRVRVIAFVNQSSVKDGGDPAIFQNRVVVTMVRQDDTWLIDAIKSY